MAGLLSRLHCPLKQAQMLLLCLGIAYLMAGSILLMQRSNIRVAQPSFLVLPPLMSLAAPPTTLGTAGLGVRLRSRWAAVQSASGAKAGQHWPTSQNLGVQHQHRHWFHSALAESPDNASPVQKKISHKGTYMGCFLHNASERALGGVMLYDLRKMTSALCQDTCSESGFQFAGLEYGAECHCGNRISSLQVAEEDCSLPCRGERASPCGGVGRLSIYKVQEQMPGHRKFKDAYQRGCFKLDNDTINTFPFHSFKINLTAQSCIEICTDKELPLAVFRKPHCFCTWASSLFSLDQQSARHQCMENTGQNRISNSTSLVAEQDYYQVYHTPVLDSRCKERMFLPQRSSSLVALSSFPGAGNTWVRHLIELMTGYYTGSFYFDGTLYSKGFKGEKDFWRSGRNICVKTHESGKKEIEMFDSAILLIRNPYRSLMAEFNRKCAGHLGHASEAQWKSKEWPEFVSSYAPWWASHALSWLKFGNHLHVIHYEELQRALLPQLRLITAFLNITVTEERLICAQSNQDGYFKRPGPQQPSFDPFTPHMRQMIDTFIHTVDMALQSRNFSGLPKEYLPR
ncbi:sialate:O-sulfotransferase 1 [Corythoichthys intestinalis]|uniref:sialate:O-sulfotransferase 1 n=1 Tax=Corythoichthys intestinalis TaxID=161448 RepID=UPI0025A508D2|nr:sialate:O-sulfotransferase 1 [Corythoichthys intestinalis]XP_057676706.1 sialate:O-sulfotransferase 1 [Corythoichthys intestinalis]XP_057676707.1 sialate:O-sulfotransferase 1 [Corythoichthys intestinalis]XP_057676708.1 sialate:O-sulfotransferase 1 [Corythoichthys intestinalis]XP_061801737.1 sialate:O-sulfotransferase 1-like [Nerophis lumbriciformis]